MKGSVIQMPDGFFHKDCFVCTHCKKPLTGPWCKHEGLPYCNEDYLNLFSPRCAHCDLIITTKYFNALGKCWHKECFLCAKCKAPVGQFYSVVANNPYCEGCSP